MRRIILPLLVIALSVLGACSPSIKVVSDVDESGRFDEYKTYNFLEFTDGNKKTIPGMELERIRVAFAHEIEKHGLRFSESDADVSVRVTVYHREAARGYYYSPWGYRYMERAIAIDYFDNLDEKHIWHAAAVGELQNDPERRKENFPRIAAELFERYPLQVTEGS